MADKKAVVLDSGRQTQISDTDALVVGAGIKSADGNPYHADWPIDTVRYYAVDYDSGSDSNLGYSDVSMAAAGTVARKTIEGLTKIFPKIGSGRRVTIAIKTRAGGAVYRNVADTEDADFDLLRGVYGYQHIVVRGTGTVATAGATAFADDAADRACLGSQVVPGTNTGGYEPTGVPTNNTFTCQLAGGGAPGLTAEPGLLGKRIRFDSSTTTAALRNVGGMIWKNTTDTITVSVNLPATPVTSDKFYIEEPGTAFDRFVVQGGSSPNAALQPSFAQNGLVFAGLRSPNTGGTHVAFIVCGWSDLVNLSFIDLASTGFNALRLLGAGGQVSILPTWISNGDTTITSGVGVRTDGWWTASRWQSIVFSSCALANGRPQIIDIGGGTINLGAGSYVGAGVLVQNARGSGGTENTVGGNNIGNMASSTTRRLRCNGGFAGASLSLANCDTFVRGVEFENAGTASLILIRGTASTSVINDCVGSSGNTGAGLDLALNRFCRVLMGQLNANTFSGDANRVIELSGPVNYSLADSVRTNLIGPNENLVQGATSTAIGPAILTTNDTDADIGQYKIVRATGSMTVRAALADNATNASAIVGSSQSAFTAAGPQKSMVVTSGPSWVQFDSTPSVGDIAYLSTSTAGNAQVAVPAVSGSNQKVRLGRVMQVSGTLGYVILRPDTISVTADGNP